MDPTNIEDIVSSFKKGKNGCVIKDFNRGKLQLVYQISHETLDVQYAIKFSETKGSILQKCISNAKYQGLTYQGFFGLTTMNREQKANDIDVKMIEFSNLNADFYQDTEKLESRDYFKFDNYVTNSDKDKTQPDSAHDLLAMRKKV